ncbi:hypothetical protein AB0L06_11705 [Spirillospora sp. NPDC052269]
MLPLVEAVYQASSELRDAVAERVPLDSMGLVLDQLFWTWDHFLGVLSEIQDEMQAAHDATATAGLAAGTIFDDKDAVRVRARLRTLDDALVNLVSCHNTLGGAHMLLSHATFALSQLDADNPTTHGTGENPAGESAGTDKEARADE